MRDLMINNSVPPISNTIPNAPKPTTPTDDSFGQIVGQAIEDVNQQMNASGKAVEALTTGSSKDIHGTMIAMEKASISFQLISQIRNKVIDAYNEVKRMSF